MGSLVRLLALVAVGVVMFIACLGQLPGQPVRAASTASDPSHC
jgi:hypothetical protein